MNRLRFGSILVLALTLVAPAAYADEPKPLELGQDDALLAIEKAIQGSFAEYIKFYDQVDEYNQALKKAEDFLQPIFVRRQAQIQVMASQHVVLAAERALKKNAGEFANRVLIGIKNKKDPTAPVTVARYLHTNPLLMEDLEERLAFSNLVPNQTREDYRLAKFKSRNVIALVIQESTYYKNLPQVRALRAR